MGIDAALRAALLISQGRGGDAVGVEIARFVFLMRTWAEKSVTLEGATRAQTQRNINRWLREFETMFRSGMVDMDLLAGYSGWAAAKQDGIKAGVVTRSEDVFLKTLFLETYRQRVLQLANRDLTQASYLRRILQSRFTGKNATEFYRMFDSFSKEASGAGLTLRERVTVFVDGPLGKKFIGLPDKAGRIWSVGQYANMYAKTRAREVEDEIHQDELVELNLDLVKVSDHGTTTPICLEFEGKFFSLTGKTQGVPILRYRPPFHPNCKHFIFAAGRNETVGKAMRKNRESNDLFRQQEFSPAQRRAVNKQKAYLRANRPTKAKLSR